MSAPQFTPGPWELLTRYSGPTAFCVGGEGEAGPFVRPDLPFVGVGYGCETIALCPSQEGGVPAWFEYASRGGDYEANARLIAAAPELYEALVRLGTLVAAKYGNSDDEVWAAVTQGIAATAKARGEQ